jgi:hypothetical protein
MPARRLGPQEIGVAADAPGERRAALEVEACHEVLRRGGGAGPWSAAVMRAATSAPVADALEIDGNALELGDRRQPLFDAHAAVVARRSPVWRTWGRFH